MTFVTNFTWIQYSTTHSPFNIEITVRYVLLMMEIQFQQHQYGIDTGEFLIWIAHFPVHEVNVL